MLEKKILDSYNLWMKNAVEDKDILSELLSINHNEKEIEDAFYKNLTFGTGGLRGIIGAGTNRVNNYTIAKATQGLCEYIKQNYDKNKRKVVVGYDSRIKSNVFAKIATEVFAANEIKCYIFEDIVPVPCVSFATRYLDCCAGVMITASHNPSKYNGYKVYNNDGCQITNNDTKKIYKEIEKISIFKDIHRIDYQFATQNSLIKYVDRLVYSNYIDLVKQQSIIDDASIDKDISIMYTPLNGTGKNFVTRVLCDCGYSNVLLVSEQSEPDGNFPTCIVPNPEEYSAMKLGVEYCKKYKSDILLATDPDCDRVGIAVKNKKNEYVLLNGNETGALLLNYILSSLDRKNLIPDNPVVFKTVVTTDLAELIAKKYNVEVINTLTGFKYIGEQISLLEKENKQSSFIFGLEESYGYLRGTYVRDKDGVVSALLICEMFCYYKSQGISLYEQLQNLYKEFGFFLERQYSYKFGGKSGLITIDSIMQYLRNSVTSIAGEKITKIIDYQSGVNGLPKSNVLKIYLENSCSIVVRPSGTEPKLKVYINSVGNKKQDLEHYNTKMAEAIDAIINNF